MLSSLNTMWVLFLLLGAISAVSTESACEAHFRLSNSCPTLPDSYKTLDDLCCSHEDEKLHCISTHTGSPDDISRAIYGCFKEIVIPAGFAMSLEPKNSPQEIQLIPCKGDYYEPNNRSSVNVRHDYCTYSKSKCSGLEQVQICMGGQIADDQCGCAAEYEPCDKGYWKSFVDDDFVCCENKTCPPGTARQVTRTVPPPCPINGTVPLDYTCHPVSSPAASSPKPPTGSTYPKPSLANANNLQWKPVLLGVLIVIIIIVLIFLLIKNKERVTQWVKNRMGFKHTRSPNSPTMQPEQIELVHNQMTQSQS